MKSAAAAAESIARVESSASPPTRPVEADSMPVKAHRCQRRQEAQLHACGVGGGGSGSAEKGAIVVVAVVEEEENEWRSSGSLR